MSNSTDNEPAKSSQPVKKDEEEEEKELHSKDWNSFRDWLRENPNFFRKHVKIGWDRDPFGGYSRSALKLDEHAYGICLAQSIRMLDISMFFPTLIKATELFNRVVKRGNMNPRELVEAHYVFLYLTACLAGCVHTKYFCEPYIHDDVYLQINRSPFQTKLDFFKDLFKKIGPLDNWAALLRYASLWKISPKKDDGFWGMGFLLMEFAEAGRSQAQTLMEGKKAEEKEATNKIQLERGKIQGMILTDYLNKMNKDVRNPFY